MRINSNIGSTRISGADTPKRSTPSASKPAEAASFQEADALDASLKSAPDVRADEIAIARMQISDVNYPPPEVIRGIAKLLADRISSNSSQS